MIPKPALGHIALSSGVGVSYLHKGFLSTYKCLKLVFSYNLQDDPTKAGVTKDEETDIQKELVCPRSFQYRQQSGSKVWLQKPCL